MSRTRLLDRRRHFRDARIFAIAVEGEREEVWYFRGLTEGRLFDTRRVVLAVLESEDGRSAPEHVAERLRGFADRNSLEPFDERWLVVDVDRHHNLLEVLAEADRAGWGLAVSNPCFEVWLQMHLAADPEGADSDGAKRAWRALRAPTGGAWRFERHHVRDAIDRARARHPSDEWVPAPAPGTHVWRILERLPPP